MSEEQKDVQVPVERPTVTIELPLTGKQVIIKKWLTQRESESVNEPFRRNRIARRRDGEDATEQVMEGFGEASMEVQHNLVTHVIVSIDGKTSGILEEYLDLPENDASFIREKIDETISPPKENGQK